MLGEAFKAAAGRMQGVVDAQGSGDLTYVPATTAGTDVDGPDLAERIDVFTAALAADLRLPAEALRGLNGTALMWFWVGWEACGLALPKALAETDRTGMVDPSELEELREAVRRELGL